jgi:hypothetical protein
MTAAVQSSFVQNVRSVANGYLRARVRALAKTFAFLIFSSLPISRVKTYDRMSDNICNSDDQKPQL